MDYLNHDYDFFKVLAVKVFGVDVILNYLTDFIAGVFL